VILHLLKRCPGSSPQFGDAVGIVLLLSVAGFSWIASLFQKRDEMYQQVNGRVLHMTLTVILNVSFGTTVKRNVISSP